MRASTKTKTEPEHPDVLRRLADRGEEALHKLTELPGGPRLVKTVNELRTHVDDLAKKVRGVDELEARIVSLEKELAALKRAKRSSSS